MFFKKGLLALEFRFQIGDLFPYFQIPLLQLQKFRVFQGNHCLTLPHRISFQQGYFLNKSPVYSADNDPVLGGHIHTAGHPDHFREFHRDEVPEFHVIRIELPFADEDLSLFYRFGHVLTLFFGPLFTAQEQKGQEDCGNIQGFHKEVFKGLNS